MRIDSMKLAMAMVKAGNLNTITLAEKSGVSRATVSVIRSGKTVKPETVAKLAIALNCDPKDLLED